MLRTGRIALNQANRPAHPTDLAAAVSPRYRLASCDGIRSSGRLDARDVAARYNREMFAGGGEENQLFYFKAGARLL